MKGEVAHQATSEMGNEHSAQGKRGHPYERRLLPAPCLRGIPAEGADTRINRHARQEVRGAPVPDLEKLAA
jgi:hypothetical protein